MVALAASAATWDRSFRDEEEPPKFLPPSSPDSSAVALPRTLPLPADEDHSLSKRSGYYNSCTGVYDRELIARLDRVCEDCYNLYRDVEVAVGCRCVLLCVDIQVIMCSEGMRCVIIDVYNAHVLICN